MEEASPVPTQTPAETPPPPAPGPDHRPSSLPPVLSAVLLILGLIVGSMYFFIRRPFSPPPGPAAASPSPSPVTDRNFFLTSVPGPVSDLALSHLPADTRVSHGLPYHDRIIAVGEESIMVYSASGSSLLAYSDPVKASCKQDLAIVGDYLYVPCWTGDYTNKYGNPHPDLELFKIDLRDLSLVRKYGHTDGIGSGANFRPVADGNILWLATFDGLGRIDTDTDRVEFFTGELGISASHMNIMNLLLDQDHVWFYVGASADTSGGLSVYDKQSGKFTAFNLKDLAPGSDRFDLTGSKAWKLASGGIDIGFKDRDPETGNYIGVIKRYSYASGKWQTVQTFSDGAVDLPVVDYFSMRSVPATQPVLTSLVVDGLSGRSAVVDIRGRNPLALSEVINGRRYILTTGSIDEISDTVDFPQVLINLPVSFTSGTPNWSDVEKVIFKVNPSDLKGFALFVPDSAEVCSDPLLVAFDLESRKILRRFFPGCKDMPAKFPRESSSEYSDGVWTVKDSTGTTVFTLDMDTLSYSPAD